MPRERSDSTTFGADPDPAAAAAFRNASGPGQGAAAPPSPPPPAAAGSGLVGACALVGAILRQVALRDCPPANEGAEGALLRGAAGFGGAAAALSSSPRGHGRRSARAARGGGGWEQQAQQGFSRQRHVGRSLLQQPRPVEVAAAPPLAAGSRGGRKPGAITRTPPPPPPLSPSVGSSSLGSPLSIENDGGGAGGIEPMRTWESEGSYEGSLLALIRLQSGDSMDQDQDDGGDYHDAQEEEGGEGASTVPSTRSSTSAASNNNQAGAGGGGGSIVPPAAATTAPLMANYCNSNGGNGNGNGARNQTALRRTETRMGTASLAALCARTLDTVAAVGRSSASGSGTDAGEDHDEQPPGGGRGGGADNGSNEEEYGNGSVESVEQAEGAAVPPPPLPAPVAATSPSQSPQRRVQLRMFGSEYARHLSSTPFSPPVPRGSKSSGGGRSSTKTSAGGGGGGGSGSPKRKNRLDKFSSSNGGGAGILRAGGDPSLSLMPPTTPGKQLGDASPFSPESPLGLVQTESDVSNLSGLTAQTNPQHVPPVLPRPPPPQPTGTSSLPKEPFAIENQSPDVLTGAITDILVTVGNERPPKGYYRIAQSSSGLDLSTMKRAKARAGGGSSAAKSSGKSALAQLGRKPVALHLNVKKEASWDRAVQRPCVTAITVIYPDRNE